MRVILLLALLGVPATGLAQANDPYKTFGDWHLTRPDTNAMTDVVSMRAYTTQFGDVDPALKPLRSLHMLFVSCNATGGFSVTTSLPGVAVPTQGRYRVDEHDASRETQWTGIDLGPRSQLLMPDSQVARFVAQASEGTELLIEANGDIFEFSLVGFGAAISELPCAASETQGTDE